MIFKDNENKNSFPKIKFINRHFCLGSVALSLVEGIMHDVVISSIVYGGM